MKVPYLDLRVASPILRKRLLYRMEKILNHGRILDGPEQREFEKKFANEIGVKYAVGVSSGSSALYLALLANGIGPGDEVITTPYTWIVTTNAIAATGATPIFVDVLDDFNVDPEKVENAITSKTKAIVPMHVAGHMCKMKRIVSISRKNKLMIIEDAAQAFCASFNGRRAGSFSHAASFSMNPMKILHAYGEAGVVVTDNKKVFHTIEKLRHAGTNRYLNKNYDINWCDYISLNHKIDTIQASFLMEELNRIHEIKSKREEIAQIYDNYLPLYGCMPQVLNQGEQHGRYNYLFTCKMRNELSRYLKNKKIENKIFYSPLTCDSNVYKNYKRPVLPVARRLLRQSLSIPMHENMTIKQAEYVVKCIKDFSSMNKKIAN